MSIELNSAVNSVLSGESKTVTDQPMISLTDVVSDSDRFSTPDEITNLLVDNADFQSDEDLRAVFRSQPSMNLINAD